MSQLGNKIRDLRGEESVRQFAERLGIAERTIRNLEEGLFIRRSTINQISEELGLSFEERLDLLESWVRSALGDDARHFRISTANSSRPRTAAREENRARRITDKLKKFPTRDQIQVETALDRPHIIRSLEYLNTLYDQLQEAHFPTKKE